jgi:endonuclease-3
MAKGKNTLAAKRERAIAAYAILTKTYPDAKCSLDFTNPLELLIATSLSAQCTDVRVNIVTKDLFKRFRCAQDYVDASQEEVEHYVKTCGFYRNKAKNIKKACQEIIKRYDGKVPSTLEELTTLGGVGRKTANVILGACFGVPGVVVDTHCGRIARRLGFTKETDPVKVEHALMKIWPEEHWTLFSHFMVFHGRALCQARSPKCSQCPLETLCPFPDTREGKKIAQ